jgi:uncharacterized protein involved in exopolysaccharide biosynthesis
MGPGPAYAVFITVFLIVMTITTAVTFILPESYASTARVKVDMPATNAGPYFIQTEVEVIQSQIVLSNAVKKLDLNEMWGKKYFGGETLKTAESMQILKQRLQAVPVRNTELIAITVYSDDRHEAAEIANAVAGAYQDHYAEKPKTEAGNAVVTITDVAVPADRPCKPNKPLNLALGAVAGVILGAGLAWLVGLLNGRT